jgi:hypothetical protein
MIFIFFIFLFFTLNLKINRWKILNKSNNKGQNEAKSQSNKIETLKDTNLQKMIKK